MAGQADTRVDQRWAESEPRLVEAIRDEILAAPQARITFARFMERALTEPGLGYYATSALRPTREGDFLSAPELHPLFGRCMARFLDAAWPQVGSPEPFRVREYGAGRGALRDSALEGLVADASPLADKLAWQSVDLAEPLDGASGPADIVLANEFVDALPVHRLVKRGVLNEAYVEWRDGWFCETLGQPSDERLAATLRAAGVELREGQRAEVCLAAQGWMDAVAALLPSRGLLLVIDYGHDAAELYGPRHMAGSLLTYRRHEVAEDPFRAVGHSDITAHVDISALERRAREAGLEAMGRTTQGRFLVELGLGGMLAELGRRPDVDPVDYVAARAAVARMLDPRHLGDFAVLAWKRPAGRRADARLPGFGGGSRV